MILVLGTRLDSVMSPPGGVDEVTMRSHLARTVLGPTGRAGEHDSEGAVQLDDKDD